MYRGRRSPANVEIIADSYDLQAMADIVCNQWKALSETEIYWSVKTEEIYLSKHLHSSIDSFFISGAAEVDRCIQAIKSSGLRVPSDGVCLEYGCGVGRVTRYLAEEFNRVVGVDISQEHIREARRIANDCNLYNTDFRLVDGFGPLTQVGYDIVFSTLVLQHNPPPLMYCMISRLLSAVNKGGLAYFQVPVYRSGYSFYTKEYLVKPPSTMDMHYMPQSIILRLMHDLGFRVLSIIEDDSLRDSMAVSNTILAEKL